MDSGSGLCPPAESALVLSGSWADVGSSAYHCLGDISRKTRIGSSSVHWTFALADTAARLPSGCVRNHISFRSPGIKGRSGAERRLCFLIGPRQTRARGRQATYKGQRLTERRALDGKGRRINVRGGLWMGVGLDVGYITLFLVRPSLTEEAKRHEAFFHVAPVLQATDAALDWAQSHLFRRVRPI